MNGGALGRGGSWGGSRLGGGCPAAGGGERRLRDESPAGSPALRRSKVCSRPKPPRSLGRRWAALVNPTGPPVFVLGDLALPSSLPKSSWIQALHARAFARALTPGFSAPLALA